jgi:ectoine hydroxylase
MASQSATYPSRHPRDRLTPRHDPVCYGWHGNLRALNAKHLADYEENGFTIIPKVFSSKEIPPLIVEMKRLQREYDAQMLAGRRPISPAFGKSLAAIHETSGAFAGLGCDRRIVAKAEQILGGEVYLHHSQINVADTRNRNSWPWHAEFERWHARNGFSRMRCMEAWVMLTASTPYNGPMRILQKSHRTYVDCADANDVIPSLATLDNMLESTKVVNIYGGAGALVLADSNLICGSAVSVIPLPRTLAMYSYNSVVDRPVARAPVHKKRRWEFFRKGGKS